MIEGLIGRKLGMTHIFSNGKIEAVTAIEAGPCVVTQVKLPEKDGYAAVQLGFGEAKRLNEPEKGHLKGLGKFRHLQEFKAQDGSLDVGQRVDVGLFARGERVDITGISKGKGFAGVVKRYHFRGGPKTHGQSDRHRAPGSVGSGTTPGRVLKGLRMAGHMGAERVTALNLAVVATDPERNLLLVRGAVPGAVGSLVRIRKSKRG